MLAKFLLLLNEQDLLDTDPAGEGIGLSSLVVTIAAHVYVPGDMNRNVIG